MVVNRPPCPVCGEATFASFPGYITGRACRCAREERARRAAAPSDSGQVGAIAEKPVDGGGEV